MQPELHFLVVDSLEAGQYQPRENFNLEGLQELAQSIRTQGLIEPLIVRAIAKQRYEIIAGERRWRAAQLAGLDKLPCLVGEYTDKQACALSLIENVQRQDLNLMEEAQGYRRLIDEFHYQQDELALLVGKSRSHVANILRLLSLGPRVKNLIKEQLISLGHARMLVGLELNQQEYFAQLIVDEHWSVRQLEQEIRSFKTKVPLKNARKDRDVARLETILEEQVGAPVQISSEEGDGGWLKLKFFDNDTLAGLLERLGLRYD